MPDKNNTALIPMTPEVADLEPAHRDFQLSVFSERRERALGELRMLTGVPELVTSLNPDMVYRLVIPSGMVLQKGKDGLYSGVLYADGHISKHARFDRVPPNLARMASAVGTQILLVSIAMQLNRIEQAIVTVSEELHNDRIAQIVAGARQYEAAMHMRDGGRRDGVILNAIQSLTEGVEKETSELRNRTQRLPDPSSTFWDNWGVSKAGRAASELRLAEDAFRAAVHGASVLSECYAALDEPQAGAVAISSCLANIQSSGIHTAADSARLVEVRDPKCLPETPWLQFSEARLAFTRAARQTLVDAERGSVAVEFEARELVEER